MCVVNALRLDSSRSATALDQPPEELDLNIQSQQRSVAVS